MKVGLDTKANDGISYVGDGSAGKGFEEVATSAGLNTAISLGVGKVSSKVEVSTSDDALRAAKSELTDVRKRSTKADNVVANRAPGSARGYDGPTLAQGRAQYNAAASRVQTIVTARSFGTQVAGVRYGYEEALKKTIGVLAPTPETKNR